MLALKRPCLERLMRYHRFLCELTRGKSVQAVTSAQIAEALEIDPTQVRKDLAVLEIRGLPRVGFDVCEVCRTIRKALGFDQQHEAVLIGVGHLGGAILAYPGFAQYGFRIVAAFDSDPRKVGLPLAGLKVRPVRQLGPFVRRRGVRMAILTVPARSAQDLADRLISLGIRAIWNFAPLRLSVPKDVLVREEHISLGLSQLAYYLSRGGTRPGHAGADACT